MQQSVDGTRHITLDAMRGFAVMGILAMNIVGFSMPEYGYVTPAVYGGETLVDRVAWMFSFVFIEGKMRGLFSLLFGASMMLVIERAEAKGESARKVHYSRMFWLAMFGLAHYFLIWFGDILFIYAIFGCIAFLFHRWTAERLIKWALIIFSVSQLIWAVQFGGLQILQFMASMPSADPEMVKLYEDLALGFDDVKDVRGELVLHRGDHWPIVAAKLREWHELLVYVAQSFGETLPLMMLGMALKKNGFVTGDWDQRDYAKWTKRLIPAGLAISLILASWAALRDFDIITSLSVFVAWGIVPRLMLTIGYAALLVMLVQKLKGGALIVRVAAAGQAAFTNYLGTSIVMTTIFYGYGLGLYGEVSRIGLWAFVIGAWVLMLLWSKPWLERFRYGPLEWLWRSLARMKLQPLGR